MLGYPSNLTLFYAEHFLTLAQKIDLTILSSIEFQNGF